MKKLLLIAVALFLSCSVFAQQPTTPPATPPTTVTPTTPPATVAPTTQPATVTPGAPPAAVRTVTPGLPDALDARDVSGVVKDSKGETVIGASVKLISAKDSLQTATNEDGIFIFKDVKLATFVITVKAMGMKTVIRKLLNNDVAKRITLDPIELFGENELLKEVVINGTPSITYKTDTVEYKASDYKVRANATVDEMLKKAEGFEVGTDGSLTFNGTAVAKARLNGKDYSGGDVAQAIQSLPADIIEKFQVVDDYGDQAGRTGIKNGDAQKVLNLTTRADRSVGNILRLSANVGPNGRHEERIFAQRINGNQQIGVNVALSNTLNGIASSGRQGNGGGGGGGNGSGGNTVSGNASVNYRDQLSKAVQVTGSYSINYSDANVLNLTSSLNSYKFFDKATNTERTDTLFNTTTSNNLTNNKTHRASVEFEITPDSSNFIRITPSFSLTNSTSSNMQDQLQKGFRNQSTNSVTSNSNNTPQLGLIAFYQYIFKKPRRNISIQFNLTSGDQKQNNEQNTLIRNLDKLPITDSVIHRIVARKNLSKNFRTSLTYVEPLSPSSQIEFNGQINYRGYDNSLLTDSVGPSGTVTRLEKATNIFNYSFTETRAALNYRLVKTKFNISLGATAIPTRLEGTNVSRGNIAVARSNFFLVPLFRFQYQWSRQQQLAINYSGTPSEPTFDQIQPVPDVSQPLNTTYGNPDLKPSFRHTASIRYSNYLSNSRLNLSGTINGSLNNNQVVSNTTLILTDKGTERETRYVNISGGKTVSGNYNISKSFSDRRYSLMLNGTASYDYSLGLNAGTRTQITTYNFRNSFGPRINPNDVIEINPYVSHSLTRSYNSLSTEKNNLNSDITRMSFNLEGRFYFGKDRSWTIEYDLSKNYVSGIANNVTKNPFVANAFIEKQMFAKRNGILRVAFFDIFNQNNFINRNITSTGYTDTRSNPLSRYFMVGFTLNLQKWSGRAQRDGRSLLRRGDGSFIY
ncbi:outer membrane beta-barrel protein [Mucilaginibacter calamicampi]|uniref:Outer membrane beta-barrel protein n=1 Tax=Mucilaginibacter calamicampi TaxID=1302352 RepID=A0ABW2Z0D5_9SPHI